MSTYLHTKQCIKQICILITVMTLSGLARPESTTDIQSHSLLPLADLSRKEDLSNTQQKPVALYKGSKNRSNDPITAFGHGTFINGDGAVFVPTPDSILEVQTYYMTKLNTNVRYAHQAKALEEKRGVIYENVGDRILANGLYLDQLLAQTKDPSDKNVQGIMNGLRQIYINKFMEKKHELEKGIFSKGISTDVARKLEGSGITVFLKTDASGDDYIKECRDAGVPIPDPMYDAPWDNRGIFDNEFISGTAFAELWYYESKEPEGACLALPRYTTKDAKNAFLLGLICLGKETSKACFWDNPNDKEFERGKPVAISEFVGGAALDTNGQGTCTACHAGENPFVVHPDKPPFAGLSQKLQPNNWHDPLVHPSWPQNPGPTNLLDTVNSSQRCDSCHQQGGAGRFPDVSDPVMSQYCSVVLETSVFGGAKRTMPQGGGSIWGYFSHIDALLSACFGDSVIVDPIPDDESFISPPIIIEPLYACATQLAVSGAILDAKVTVFINGVDVATEISRSPSQLNFNVPALQVGDIVTAVQEFDGLVSDPSNAATVRDHKVDFPAGLPKPDIDPNLIYECGNTIAVRHVPGAKLTVLVNGTDPRSRNTSTGWSSIYPGKYPFDLGDEFTASIGLCADSSPISDKETAVSAPAAVNAPTLNPQQTYIGQELVNIENILHGAWVDMGEASFGDFGKFSTPISSHNEYDVATKLGAPTSAGDQLYVRQTLCDKGPTTEIPPAVKCEDIPAPKIRIPLHGEDLVIVTESVPGARIHVFDAGNIELGDGSGSIIALNRTLMVGEQITVTQSIGDCKGKYGYKVTVRKIERQKDRNKDR